MHTMARVPSHARGAPFRGESIKELLPPRVRALEPFRFLSSGAFKTVLHRQHVVQDRGHINLKARHAVIQVRRA